MTDKSIREKIWESVRQNVYESVRNYWTQQMNGHVPTPEEMMEIAETEKELIKQEKENKP